MSGGVEVIILGTSKLCMGMKTSTLIFRLQICFSCCGRRGGL